MHWLVIFACLTMPCIMGVAFTLAAPSTTPPYGLGTVAIVGVCWLIIAFQGGRSLKKWKPQTWVRWWVTLMVFLPLLVALLFHVSKDPEVCRVWDNRKPVPVSENLATAAPSRHLPSWSETWELIACVRRPAWIFSVQLTTCLPPLWWLAALVIALWKGK